jgi:alkanesulfonate monooxygenase SsuD/methylene tetrahydromethanopterin reductase-like flavin-dependent oxidoreductase (luciferase family)
MQIGIGSFAAAISDPASGLTLSPVERMHHLLEEIELADRVGLDVFGIGEHHRPFPHVPLVYSSHKPAHNAIVCRASAKPGYARVR